MISNYTWAYMLWVKGGDYTMSDTPEHQNVTTLQRKAVQGSIIKAKELIDVLSPAGLTVQSRRIYNLLLEAAHDNMGDKNYEHTIALKELRGTDESNFRLKEALAQLMTTVITVQIHGKTGKEAEARVQLIGGNKLELKKDGVFRYRFDPVLIEVLQESRAYAQLKKSVIWAFSSKYAMALYEVIERRINLDFMHSEKLTLEQIRYLLDVPVGKYQRFGQLNQAVLKAAIDEVNHLCDFSVDISPVKTGRKVTHVNLTWWMKSDDELAEAKAERRRSRIGRKERREKNVEYIADYKTKLRESVPTTSQGNLGFDLDGDEITY